MESAPEEVGTISAEGGSRRELLIGLGLIGVATAACGKADDGSDAYAPAPAANGNSDTGEQNTGTKKSGGAVLAKTSAIPVGGGVIFKNKKIVVTQPTKGTFKAFSAVCTHAGCTVGGVSGGTINCPCHGSKFAVADGSVVAGPAPSPLEAQKIKISGGGISLA